MIPVYVNVYNRLTTTKILCDQLSKMEEARPVIIDNDSTWEPLLDWYTECDYEVIRLRENLGHLAPWKSGIIRNDASRLYCVTDCDLDLDGVPNDLLQVLKLPLSWGVIKSGIGLRIDDLPKTQDKVISWERRFWRKPTSCGRYYWAPVDTTLAMYRGDTPESLATKVAVKATRTGGMYVARHMPWYLDCNNLDEENANYFNTANSSNSWRPSGNKLESRFVQ